MTSGHQTAACPRPASTISFKPQQTQNTALVVEHRCLYTHDLRRKAKRWQDGFLRFHTFNKRIMIYDVPRNYIGDTHWREENPVQDGDELELDRPVLVQVGEQVGSIEQDLTGLLEKRQKKDCTTIDSMDLPDSSPPIPMTGNGHKTKPLSSAKLKPKSLNTLLGTPRGATGKAVLPMKSPYEVRKAAENASEKTIPPTSKRRIESPTTCAQLLSDKQRRPRRAVERQVTNETAVITTVANPSTERLTSPGNKQPIAFAMDRGNPGLADFSTIGTATSCRDAELQLSEVESPSRGQRSHPKSLGVNALQVFDTGCRTRPETRKGREPEAQGPPLNTKGTPEILNCLRSPEPPDIISILSDIRENVSSSNGHSKPRSKLRVASNKPRRKLMYRELLPQNVSVVSKGSRNANLDDESGTVKSPFQPRKILPDEQDPREAKRRRLDAKVGLMSEKPIFLEDVSSKPDQLFNVNGRPSNLSKRDTRRQQAKGINEGENSLSRKAIQPIVPVTNSTVHDTNLTLAKMDEILLRGSEPQTSATLSGKHSVDDNSPIQEPHPPSNDWTHDSSTLQNPNLPKSSATVQQSRVLTCESTIQPSISPSSETRVGAFPEAQQSHTPNEGNETPEHLVVPASVKRPPLDIITDIDCPRTKLLQVVASEEPDSSDNMASHGISAATKHATSVAAVTTLAPPEPCPAHVEVPKAVRLLAPPSSETCQRRLDIFRLPNFTGEGTFSGLQATKATTSLPPFKPLCCTRAKQRSPIKKSISDTSSITGARAVTSVGNLTTVTGEPKGAKEQVASPWSREAWDLFGCGRDGRTVDFKTFCLSEGV